MLNRVQRPDIELRLFFLIATVCGFSMLVAGALKLIEVVSGTRVSWKTTAAVQSVTDSGRALVQDIEKVVQPAMRRSRIIASTDEVIEAMKHSNLDALVLHCNKAIQNSTEVDAIAFFDRDGKILAVNSIYADGKAVPQNRIQQVMRRDFSSREIITGCLKNQARRETLEFQTTCDITPAFFDSSGLAVAHSVPVLEGNGDQVGVVSTRLNFERLSSMIAKRRIADGMGAIHFITDSGGYFDEKINSGGVSPLSKQDLLPRLTPLLSGTASQLAFEQGGNLYFLYRLATLETLDGGGIQAMITVPKAWGVRETALEQLLTVGGLFSLAALSLTVVGVLRLLQRTRGQKEECQRLAHIAQRTSNAVVFCDEQRRIRWVNEGFVAVTGYEKDDVVGKNISRLFGLSQSHPIEPNQLSDAIDEGLFFRGELLCRRKNGDEFWCEVEFQPMFTDGGRIQEFVVIIRDVTENSNEKRRLQSVFAAVAEGIVVQTVSGEIVDCNASAERILGLTSDQMRGRTSLDSRWKAIREDGTELPGEDHPAMVTIRTGKPQRDFVFGIHTPENITRWISVNTEPILDSSGQLSMVVTSFADITQFREQTQRLQVIVDASKIGTWDWDVQTGSAIFNDHWASMLGYEIGEMELHVSTWERIIDPTWNQKTWSVVQDHLNGRSSEYRQELHLRRKDGTYAWVLAAGRVISQLADGRPKRMVGIHLDITESKLAEMKIRNLSERYAAAISGTSDGLWDWNCKNEDCWFSERFWTLLGFPDAGPFPAANFNSFVDRLHSNEVNEIWEAIRQHQEEGQDFDHEYRLRHENGEYRWFRVRAATQFDSDGRPIRMAGSIQDIHDLKLTQSSLINANARAQSASAAKSAFLANMSHEIRTPMTAILGYSDLLLQEINNELGKNSFREYVGTIRKNGEQLLDLINDILDISKIEAGKMSVECLPTHPDALINDVLSLMAVKAHAKGLKIDLSIEPSVPATIQTDPVRLRQILVNLIGNAIKFTEQGSVRLHVACSASEQRLYLTVEDTGIGMTPEQISRIFGAFEQADTTTTRKYGGSGLGLHICNRLAEMLGGTISIESRVGIGSKFTVSIATGFISSNAANTCELSSRPQGVALLNHIIASNENHPLAGLRILLAEDGLDNQRLISHILRKAGAEVQIADNGTFVVGLLTNDGTLESSLIEPCPFDLLVTDMQMPEMDGYETARWLRARGSEMPILALTAHAMTEELELCIAAGCNAYATKPINKTLLINLCWEWANRTLTPT